MTTSIISNLADCAVRFNDGSINVAASLSEFESQLNALAESEYEQADRICGAVHSVFDANRGKVLPMPALCNLAVTELGVTPEKYAATLAAVGNWVRHSPQFTIAKGKGGGVKRVND
jgi:hypothetical protein